MLIEAILTSDPKYGSVIRRCERLLSHSNSGVRIWFHYVCWVLRDELGMEEVRSRLLLNLADKLGGLAESVGLLAVLHDKPDGLDVEADDFEAPESFVSQYAERLERIRTCGWSAFGATYWRVESHLRRLIWESIQSIEIKA
jgi:hypothetical protein